VKKSLQGRCTESRNNANSVMNKNIAWTSDKLLFVYVAALLKEIDSLAEDYLNNVRTMSGEMRKEHLAKIEKLFSKSKEFGDDKVQLAMQTYEMVI